MIPWWDHYSSAGKKPTLQTPVCLQQRSDSSCVLLKIKALRSQTFNLMCSPKTLKQAPVSATNTNEIFQMFLCTNCCSTLSSFYAETRGRLHSSLFSSSSHIGAHSLGVWGGNHSQRMLKFQQRKKYCIWIYSCSNCSKIRALYLRLLVSIASFDIKRSLQQWDLNSSWC